MTLENCNFIKTKNISKIAIYGKLGIFFGYLILYIIYINTLWIIYKYIYIYIMKIVTLAYLLITTDK